MAPIRAAAPANHMTGQTGSSVDDGMYRRVRRGLAPAAKSWMLRTGVYGALRRLVPNRKLAILRYHAICGSEGHAYASPGICVTPAAFEAHVRYLTERYRVLSLEEVVNALRTSRALPPNVVVLTFDDGYADNFEAAKVLQRHGATATFYLTAGCLDGGMPFWPGEIRYLVSALSGTSVTLSSGGAPISVSLDDREAAVRQLTHVFKSRSIPVRDRLREELRRAAGHPEIPRFMLAWDQVREMHGMGMTIGAHTVTHPNLPSAGLEDAAIEIRESRRRLEEQIGASVTMFSYPNGGAERYYTPELQRIVREAGYASAATSRNGFADVRADLYALERVEVAERLEDLAFALEVERFLFRP